MPRTTTQTKPKKAAKSTNTTNTEQEAEQIEAFPKNKKALEIEEPEAIPGTEEKLDEDGMPIEESEDADTDDSGLDDTEDFGDRWEE